MIPILKQGVVLGNGESFVFNRYKRKENLLKNMLIDGIEIVGFAALATYTWKSNCHPVLPLIFSAKSALSVINICLSVRKYFLERTSLQIHRLWSSLNLAYGGICYFSAVHGFSEALKCNKILCIPFFGVAVLHYSVAVSSVTKLFRTASNITGRMKCCELLFGPALIACAECYLLVFGKHGEKWLPCLLMVASGLAANYTSYCGHKRVESNGEPRWLLFKGLELFVGGCYMLLNGAVLVVYSINNQLHAIFSVFSIGMILTSFYDIDCSLEVFQSCVRMHPIIFDCLCDMILGPTVFLSALIGIRCIRLPIPDMLPLFVFTAGMGLFFLGTSVFYLYVYTPDLLFRIFCQKVLGPVAIVYSSVAAAYFGYIMGWKYSLTTIPFICASIYATRQGYKCRITFSSY